MKGIVGGKCNIPRHACNYCRHHPGENGFPLECPHGYSADNLPILIGDAVAKVATPIARRLKLGCVDPKTGQLRPGSPCAKKKRWLNRFAVR